MPGFLNLMNRFFRSYLLGRLFGRALPPSQHLTTKADFHFEFLFVLGTTLSNQTITGGLISISLGQPLELALEILGQDIFFIQTRSPEP